MRKLSALLTILILASLLVPAVLAQGPAQEVVGDDPVIQPSPGIPPALTGGAGAAAAPVGTKDVLWEQWDNGLNSLVSEYFEQYALGVFSVDDFENAETWYLESIYIDGQNNSGTGLPYATSLNWVIYEEVGAGEPPGYPWDGSGTEFWSYGCAPGAPEIVMIDNNNVEIDLTIALGAPLELPPGHWWISFFPAHDTSLWGQWWWSTADPDFGYDSLVIDPTNFFGMGWTTWTPWTVYDPSYDQFAFRLEGTVGGVQEPDIRVEPEALEATLCPDTMMTVGLDICNDGTAPLTWTLEELGGAPEAVLWDNGPLVTHPGGGYNGADASVLQTNLGMSTYGFGYQYYYGYRVSDDFVVDADWTVDQITFFGYQTNSPTNPSTFTAYNLAVWDGAPNGGGSIIWGDYVTNCMVDTAWTGAYRVTDYDMMGTARPIMYAVCETPGLVLGPGQYWLDWQADGSLSSGPWAPPITILGETTTGDALQYTTAWASLVDTGSGTPQGLPFVIEGTAGGEPGIPWLSEDPTEGEVAPGECQTVDVTFDSTGLAPDVYTGELLINSNDPDEPETFVPVTLTVEPCEDTMHVGGIEGMFTLDYLGRPVLRMHVLVEDGQAMPLGNVAVTAWMWVPDAGPIERTRITKMAGWARFHWGSTASGTWEICVENLELAGYTYVPGDNVVTCMDWYY